MRVISEKNKIRSVLSARALPVAIAILAVACAPAGPAVEMQGDELSLPEGTGEPNLVVTRSGDIVLTWHEPRDSTYALNFAVRSEGVWSDPRVIEAGIPFLVNWADYPSLAETADGSWIVHWLQRDRQEMLAYSVRMAVSHDRGITWSDPFTLHTDDTPTEHGFVSMTPVGNGMAALWLDGRQTVEVNGVRGPMSLRFTTLDSNGVRGREVLVDDRICDCCNTAMTSIPGGLVVAYRDRSEEEVRDIGVRRLVDGDWSDVAHVGNDNWVYPGCPVNGPALDSRGDDVVIAWYTAPEQRARVNLAFSHDAGQTFSEPVRVDEGSTLGRVDVQFASAGAAIVTYMENVDDGALIRSRIVRGDASADDPWTVASTAASRSAGFPEVAVVGNEIFYAYTIPGDGGGVRVTKGIVRGVSD